MATNFEEIGVELIIDGLFEFVKGMDVVDQAIDKFRKNGEKTEEAFRSTNTVISRFGDFLQRVAEIAGGIIIARVFERMADAIGGMVREAIAAGAEFQSLIIRLEGLIATDLVSQSEGVLDFGDALQRATPLARDLFFWVEQLALQSPFDISEIANVVTLAQSYGFGTERAQELTAAIVDFTSGMGLSGIVIQRIIENLGQMEQQGKVTGTELRDLGRGAFVPINDILARMQETLGVTTERFIEMRRDGILPVSLFLDSFIEIIGERFPNAGQRASRTITAVIGNFKDLVQGVIGFNVVRPILDSISGRMADILDTLTTGVLGDRLLLVTEQIGLAIKGILDLFLGVGVSPDILAENIVSTLEIIAGKLIGIRSIIESVFAGEATAGQGLSAILQFIGVPEDVIQNITNFADAVATLIDNIRSFSFNDQFGEFFERVQGILDNFAIFWDNNGDRIVEAFDRLLGAVLGTGETGAETILGVVLLQLERVFELIEEFSESAAGEGGESFTEKLEDFVDFIVDDFLPALEGVFDFIEEHPDLAAAIALIFAVLSNLNIGVLGGAIILLLPILKNLAFIIIEIGALIAEWLLTLNPLALALIALGVVIVIFGKDAKDALFRIVESFVVLDQIIREKIALMVAKFFKAVTEFGIIARAMVSVWWENFGASLSSIILGPLTELFRFMMFWISGNFIGAMANIGRDFVVGLWNGFRDRFFRFMTDVSNLFISFRNWIKALLGIASPSTIFEEFGRQVMEGFALGIQEAITLPENAMRMAVSHTIAPVAQVAAAGTSAGGISNTQNFNMTIHSAARTEPIINDFRVLESLATLDA